MKCIVVCGSHVVALRALLSMEVIFALQQIWEWFCSAAMLFWRCCVIYTPPVLSEEACVLCICADHWQYQMRYLLILIEWFCNVFKNVTRPVFKARKEGFSFAGFRFLSYCGSNIEFLKISQRGMIAQSTICMILFYMNLYCLWWWLDVIFVD